MRHPVLETIIVWSWAWINRTSPSKEVGLGSPLAACSVYGDLTRSIQTVNNFNYVSNYETHVCLCIWGPYVRLAVVPNMLSSWNKVITIIICTSIPIWCLLQDVVSIYRFLIIAYFFILGRSLSSGGFGIQSMDSHSQYYLLTGPFIKLICRFDRKCTSGNPVTV